MGLTRSPSVLTLTIASGNPSKVAEIEAMLGPLPLMVVRQPSELDVEETGTSYLENALLKASAAAQLTGTWALACLLYTSPSPRDVEESRMPSSA